ncbi:MAG: metallophosphoesterase [Actinobacteria bacterium]|nr:metallophosphoesterase [Actinomycetota bacterium]
MSLFRRVAKGGRRKFTRLFFATDVHGSDDCFKKFLNAATLYKADAIILGGDITGKTVVPIIENADGGYGCEFQGHRHRMRSLTEVEKFEKLINRSGSYPYRTTESEMERLMRSPESVDEVTQGLTIDRVREWVKLAEERLGDSGITVVMGAGNDDFPEIDGVINESSFVINHHERVFRITEHHEMIGLGYANQTPWDCPRDISEEELGRKIDEVANQVEDMERCIFCIHVPPVDSTIDLCPQLDSSVYPPRMISDSTGQPLMFGAGSTAVREAIERYEPALGLHGHIHESRGVTRIGRTMCINPGSEYSEGLLRGAIINLTPDKVLSYQLTSG